LTLAVFSGFEVGIEMLTGAVLRTATPPEYPFREVPSDEVAATLDALLTAPLANCSTKLRSASENLSGFRRHGGEPPTSLQCRVGRAGLEPATERL
jgi:hypothetical protein